MQTFTIECPAAECGGTVRYLLTKSLDDNHQGRIIWDGTMLTRTCHGEHIWEREHDDLAWEQAMTLDTARQGKKSA